MCAQGSLQARALHEEDEVIAQEYLVPCFQLHQRFMKPSRRDSHEALTHCSLKTLLGKDILFRILKRFRHCDSEVKQFELVDCVSCRELWIHGRVGTHQMPRCRCQWC